MIFYLTATGNSLYVAKQIAGEQELASIPQEMRRHNRAYRSSVIGIVCPIFGHELPSLVRDFVRSSTFECDYLFVIGTYGCNHGDFAEHAQEVLADAGRAADYINTIIMVDNGLPAFDIAEELRIDPEKRVDEHIAALKADIDARACYLQPVTEADREHHRTYLQFDDRIEFLAEGELLRVDEACTSCGICVRICPTGNIALDPASSRAVHGQTRCIGCLACIHACPPKATKFVELTEKNPDVHYRNPHIALHEIVRSNDQTR